MQVKEAMHKGVEWASPDTPLREIARLMRQHDVGAIPIGENDKLVGMVTDRDIVCKGLATNGFDFATAKARDVMTKGIHTCRAEDELEAAVRHMQDLKVRRLPVIDRGRRMVGILSLGDVGHAAPTDVTVHCLKRVAAHH
jgi:CBS domain-containing protein